MTDLKVYDGTVYVDSMEKHDSVVLVQSELDPSVPKVNGVPQTNVYPRYLLDGFVGERVRIYIVPIAVGPEPAPRALYTFLGSGISPRFETCECSFCRYDKPCALGATPAWGMRILPSICADCALRVCQAATARENQ